jgi:hypothetical protein
LAALPFQPPPPSCRLTRADENTRELVGFFPQVFRRRGRYNSGFNQQLQPESGFISLLDHNTNFCDEFFVGSGSADRAVIRSNSRPTAKQLPTDDARFIRLWKRPAEFDDRERE